MSPPGALPPRVALWILRAAVGADEADVTAAELGEAYHGRVERDGVRFARRWYWRQVAGFAARSFQIRRARTPETGPLGWLAELGRDVRWAYRGLRRRPSFVVVAVLTLALGIGANSAVFALVSAQFFNPLPYERPDEVVLVWETQRGTMDVSTASPGNYYSWREQASSFTDIAAFNLDNATLSGGDGPAERVRASVVAPHFFDVLGARPFLGATFDEESARLADGRQVILGHGLWTRRYGADPEIVGRDIRVDGRSYTVVGVMPPSFRQPERQLGLQRPELWRPLLLEAQRNEFGGRYLRTVARLAPGVGVELAQAEMDRIAERMALAHPEENEGHRVLVRTLGDYLMGDARPTLLTLLAAGEADFQLV
jgi:putative ABC transport system permease protein